MSMVFLKAWKSSIIFFLTTLMEEYFKRKKKKRFSIEIYIQTYMCMHICIYREKYI